VHLLNNQSIRVWAAVAVAAAAAVFVERWICDHNLVAEVVGYKPILLYFYNGLWIMYLIFTPPQTMPPSPISSTTTIVSFTNSMFSSNQ
jgi:hypothetical protein